MLEILVILICLALNAILAAFEMAFVSVHKPELRSLARSGNKDAQAIVSIRQNPERTLSIIQIGITLVGALAAVVGGASASENLEPYLISRYGIVPIIAELLVVALVVIPITYLNVVIGELVPKSLALRNPTKIVLAGARWLFIADVVLSPLVTAFEWSTKTILNIFFKRTNSSEIAPPLSIDIDALSPTHQKFMLNMFEIEKKRIRDILLPWSKVVSVKNTNSVEELAQTILTSGHTRMPVTNNGDVMGILHTKEFMALKESGENNWQPIIRPVIFVQPMDSAFKVLRTFQEKRNHMTVVVSQNGEKLGIVTLEDILEEIIGEIYDEDDDDLIRKVYAAKAKSRVIPKTT